MALDFKSLLGRSLDDVKKPSPVPAGTFYGVIQRYEFGETSEKKTPFVRFHIGLTAPGDDIDPELLIGVDLSKRALRKDFFLTPDAEYRLKDALNALGINTTGRTFAETIPEVINAQVLVEVTQRPSKDGKDIFNDIGSLTAVN